MTTYPKERRHHRRHCANFSIFHVGSGQSGRAYTRDISEGGAFVETRQCLTPGTFLDIEVFLDLGDEVCSMYAKAEVVWCAPKSICARQGMGIRFISMDEASKEALRRTISRLSSAEDDE